MTSAPSPPDEDERLTALRQALHPDRSWDLLEAVSDLVHCFDREGRLRYANRAWRQALGYTSAEVAALTLTDVVASEELPGYRALLTRLPSGRVVEGIETTLVAKDGGRVRVRGSINAQHRDDEQGLIHSVVRDVTAERARETERTDQERALRESEARHRATLEAVLDAVLTLDRQGTVVSCNPAVERVFGYSPEELVGRDISLLLPAQGEGHNFLESTVTTLIGHRHEIQALRKDGTRFAAALAMNQIQLGESRFFTWVVEDISERKAAERAKDEFVSTVSHELRTPLTSIRGSLGLLEGGVLGELPPQAADVLRIACTNSERLIRLINELLDFEKLRANRLELRLQAAEPEGLVVQALEAVNGMARERGVTLSHDLVANDTLRVDPDRFTQVLTNLLSNAIKFSPAGGEVLVRVARDIRGRVRFEVRDQGPGIPQEQLEQLFERFRQLDSSATRKVGGTGLGLAISRALIQQHGGEIGVESTLDKGSTFWVALPPHKRPGSSARISRAKQVDAVLVVEDDPDVAHLLALLLNSEDYDVVCVNTVADAETYLREWRPLAVLLDLTLPDGSGLGLLEQLEGNLRDPGVPTIVISGTDAQQQGGFSHPLVVDWLVKPYDDRELLRAVRRAVNRTGPARVLVLEDDPRVRLLVVTQLEELGVECLEAADGMAGVTLAKTSRPDLIVLDVGLPRLNGFEVVDILRSELAGQSIPLIVFSGRELSASDRFELQLGPTRYLTKGHTKKDELQDAARELLGTMLDQSG